MGGFFGGAPSPPDNSAQMAEMERQKKVVQDQADKQAKDIADKKAQEEDARSKGLRGYRSLLTGSELGYDSTLGSG